MVLLLTISMHHKDHTVTLQRKKIDLAFLSNSLNQFLEKDM